jgi:hypothetical protein
MQKGERSLLLIYTDIQMLLELLQHNVLFFYLCGFLVVKLCHYHLLASLEFFHMYMQGVIKLVSTNTLFIYLGHINLEKLFPM